MAKTKQTARKCYIVKGPRKPLVAQKIARKSSGDRIKKAKKDKKNLGLNGLNDQSS